MRRIIPLIALVLLGGTGPSQGAPFDADPFVLLEKEALLVPPARLVATGIVEQAKWSPDGRYVLALAQELPHNLRLDLTRPPVLRSRLVLWSSASGEAKELWSAAAPDADHHFAWFSRGEAAAVLLDLQRPIPTAERQPGGPGTRKERWLYRLEARRGVMRPVTRVSDHAYLSSAPAAPGVVVWSWDTSDRLILRLEGPPVTLRLPDGVLHDVRWLRDGRRGLLGGVGQRSADGKFKTERALIVDAVTGTVVQSGTAGLDAWAQPVPNAPVRLVRGQAALRDGDRSAQLTPLWLESVLRTEKPRVLLAAFAEKASLSPSGDRVLYTDDRGAWVVSPLSMPKEAYFAARAAAMRATLMSNGKQLGTALHMYAQDNDERLPGMDEPVNSLLSPYLKNEALFEGFVYTFPGGPLAGIDKPAQQVLGHVVGQGGRALIYADGHVTWEPAASK